jgi:hypothetical protein
MKWQHCTIYAERVRQEPSWNKHSYPRVGNASEYCTELDAAVVDKLVEECAGVKRDVAERLLIAAEGSFERAIGNHQLALAHHYARQDRSTITSDCVEDGRDVYLLAKSLGVDEHSASALLTACGWSLARANKAVNRAQSRLDEKRSTARNSAQNKGEKRVISIISASQAPKLTLSLPSPKAHASSNPPQLRTEPHLRLKSATDLTSSSSSLHSPSTQSFSSPASPRTSSTTASRAVTPPNILPTSPQSSRIISLPESLLRMKTFSSTRIGRSPPREPSDSVLLPIPLVKPPLKRNLVRNLVSAECCFVDVASSPNIAK